jgi:hypothetical protein
MPLLSPRRENSVFGFMAGLCLAHYWIGYRRTTTQKAVRGPREVLQAATIARGATTPRAASPLFRTGGSAISGCFGRTNPTGTRFLRTCFVRPDEPGHATAPKLVHGLGEYATSPRGSVVFPNGRHAASARRSALALIVMCV